MAQYEQRLRGMKQLKEPQVFTWLKPRVNVDRKERNNYNNRHPLNTHSVLGTFHYLLFFL